MRILVCGGRDCTNKRFVFDRLDLYRLEHGVELVVHGGARGADAIAHEWAMYNEINIHVYPAKWDLHGKRAGPIRNLEMISRSPIDVVIAFPGGRGTQNMIAQAVGRGIPVIDAT